MRWESLRVTRPFQPSRVKTATQLTKKRNLKIIAETTDSASDRSRRIINTWDTETLGLNLRASANISVSHVEHQVKPTETPDEHIEADKSLPFQLLSEVQQEIWMLKHSGTWTHKIISSLIFSLQPSSPFKTTVNYSDVKSMGNTPKIFILI